MKLKFIPLLLVGSLSSGISYSQKTVSLGDCYDLAMKKSALSGEADVYSSISGLNDKNLKSGWLPSLDANASALYNSDVVDLAKNMAALPALAKAISPMPHDQYKITLDINQVIYDGGAIKKGRELEKIDQNLNRKQTETDMYRLRDQVNLYFFSIMLLDRQREILESFRSLLSKRIMSMQSAISNGTLLKADEDILESEKIKTDQQLLENSLKRGSFIKVLSDLTGEKFDSSTVLVAPVSSENPALELKRPELQLYDLRKDKLGAAADLEQTKRMPRAFGFATFGYGKPPGQDFFKNSFGTYYVVGGGIKWNIFDWNHVKNQKQVISLQQGIIDERKKDLEDNLRRQLELKKSEIASLNALIGTDAVQVALRKKISASAESKLNNGVITSTEYLNELNSEQQAEINSEIHKINLALAKVEYLNISGNDIK
ncbi:MAG TPA: TolC family protein [Bacteroidales bacterium]|nr:TolC family protein [Bacteroidales bacterium]